MRTTVLEAILLSPLFLREMFDNTLRFNYGNHQDEKNTKLKRSKGLTRKEQETE